MTDPLLRSDELLLLACNTSLHVIKHRYADNILERVREYQLLVQDEYRNTFVAFVRQCGSVLTATLMTERDFHIHRAYHYKENPPWEEIPENQRCVPVYPMELLDNASEKVWEH